MAESNQSSPNLSQQNQTPRTVTETVQEEEEATPSPPVLQLRLQQAKNGHKVKWATDTVDNEFMGKKKSKCCCIYEKPKVFGESDTSSEEDDDGCTPHCKGHKKKCYRHHKPHGPDAGKDEHNDQDSLHKDGPSTIPEPSRADDASPT